MVRKKRGEGLTDNKLYDTHTEAIHNMPDDRAMRLYAIVATCIEGLPVDHAVKYEAEQDEETSYIWTRTKPDAIASFVTLKSESGLYVKIETVDPVQMSFINSTLKDMLKDHKSQDNSQKPDAPADTNSPPIQKELPDDSEE